MNIEDLSKQIVELVGGISNIRQLSHCVTRLRFELKDSSKADLKAIEKLDGVMGTQVKGGQTQVIIGPAVGKVYNAILKAYPSIQSGGEVPEDDNGVKKSLPSKMIDALSTILVESLAPIVGGGMLKGFLFLFTQMGWMAADGGTYFILNIASDCMFYFFPFLLAAAAAKKFRTNMYMALSLAGALMYPTILAAIAEASAGVSVSFFGVIPIHLYSYASSILPIILATWVMSYLYRFLERVIPSMVTIIFTPLITLIIMVPLMLFLIAPIGYFIGEYVAIGIDWLITTVPWLAGFVVGASRPILVLVGMHHAIRPITQQQISTYGYSTIAPMNFMSTMAQASAALGIWISAKNPKVKQVSMSSTISGFMGITEPALYGVLMKYKAAMLGACLGGGIGGLVATVLGAKAYAPAMPSLISIPTFLGDGFAGFMIAIVVTVISTIFITVFASKTLFKIEEEEEEESKEIDENILDSQKKGIAGEKYELSSPVSGEMYSLKDVPDTTFSSGIIGEGVAIHPSENVIVAPFDGQITTVFQTGHAYGLKYKEQVETLIHIGIDTVELKGQYFEILCKENQWVKKGDPLARIEREKIQEAGYDPSILFLVTNTSDFLSVVPDKESGTVQAGERILTVIQ